MMIPLFFVAVVVHYSKNVFLSYNQPVAVAKLVAASTTILLRIVNHKKPKEKKFIIISINRMILSIDFFLFIGSSLN